MRRPFRRRPTIAMPDEPEPPTIRIARWRRLALLGCLLAVWVAPLDTFGLQLRSQYGAVIEELAYGGPGTERGTSEPWFSVTLRPTASEQELAAVLHAVDTGWWRGFSAGANGEVRANGVWFCPDADHLEDRHRLREALRAAGESLTLEWPCEGYPLPDVQQGFDGFAAQTAIVGRVLDAAGVTQPVMIADGLDWAELSRTLPPVAAAVTAIEQVEFADFTSTTATLYVQPTWRLDEARAAARAAAKGRLDVTVENAFLGETGASIRRALLSEPGIGPVVVDQFGVTVTCADGPAAARAADWIAERETHQTIEWRIRGGGATTGAPPLIEYATPHGSVPSRPTGLDGFAELAADPTTTSVQWFETLPEEDRVVTLVSAAENGLALLPRLRDLVGDTSLLSVTWNGGSVHVRARQHLRPEDVRAATVDPATVVATWNR